MSISFLNMSNPERVEKHHDVLKDQWDYHEIDENYKKLKHCLSSMERQIRMKKAVNNLSTMITSIMIHSERKCSRIFHKPTIPCGPIRHTAIKNIQRKAFLR